MWVCLRVAESKVRCNLLQTALHSTRPLSTHQMKHHGPSNKCSHLQRVPSNDCMHVQHRSAQLHVQHRSAQHLPHMFTLSLGGLQVRCMTSGAHKPDKQQIEAAQQYLNRYKKGRRTLRDWVMMTTAIMIFMFGVSAASVPLYKIFCSATGYGGTTKKHNEEDNVKVRSMTPVEWRPVTVRFTGNVNPGLDWDFAPVQNTVTLVPGETCLAFFTAKNNSAKVMTGISTYNVTPFEAGAYFNKIQCFCFDEQTLNPGEELDMPVFFYIDPEFAEDADLVRLRTKEVQLHYTFFDTDQEHSRFGNVAKMAVDYFTGVKNPMPSFEIPEGENIVKVNEKVYRETTRKGYNKDFVTEGMTVVCHVTGTMTDSGKLFWSTKGGTPFSYTAGTRQLIDGWEEGAEGMSEGEIAKIHIASEKAYGKVGNRSWNIPGNTNITFELEILAVR